MEVYGEIRRRYVEGQSQRQIAQELGISRNTVEKYCKGGVIPGDRKTPKRESPVLTEQVCNFIKNCLSEDENEGLKKQNHTAKRIYDRLVEECGFSGGESTIRRKVRELKDKGREAFIPLSFEPGEALQVDWGEATIYLAEERVKIYIFCARLCYSAKPIIIAYKYQNEQCFLDAFVQVFTILGGVPDRVIFDNARVAVKEGFGAHAKKQAGYTALSIHYGFKAEFCNPASGHEKGLVEGLVGWGRRNILVPIPKVEDLEELNNLLIKRCEEYEKHKIKGKDFTVGELFREEKKALTLLPICKFETAKCLNARVSAYSTVRFETNDYSVPIKYVRCQVGIKGYPERVEIYYGGELISKHTRLYGKNQKSCRLVDYLPLLEEKGRAVLNAVPVKQNLSAEAYENLKKHIDDREKVIEILRREAGICGEVPKNNETNAVQETIKNSPEIKSVDLQDYDELLNK